LCARFVDGFWYPGTMPDGAVGAGLAGLSAASLLAIFNSAITTVSSPCR
jgi:predicted NAD/FAD-binding protein